MSRMLSKGGLPECQGRVASLQKVGNPLRRRFKTTCNLKYRQLFCQLKNNFIFALIDNEITNHKK